MIPIFLISISGGLRFPKLGGFFIVIDITYTGEEPYETPGEIEITIDEAFMLIGQKYNIPFPTFSGGHEWIYLKYLVFGFGRGKVTATIDLDNDGTPELEGAAYVDILGPYIRFDDSIGLYYE